MFINLINALSYLSSVVILDRLRIAISYGFH
jgi:hypothetical protein